MTLAEVDEFEMMIALARLSVYMRRSPEIVAWFWAHATPEQVATYRRLYATNPEIRRAVNAAYRDEERNLSEPEPEPATQDGPHDAAPDPAGSRSPNGSSDV